MEARGEWIKGMMEVHRAAVTTATGKFYGEGDYTDLALILNPNFRSILGSVQPSSMWVEEVQSMAIILANEIKHM